MRKNIYLNIPTPLETSTITAGIVLTFFAMKGLVKGIKLHKDFETKKLKPIFDYTELKEEYPNLNLEKLEKTEYRTYLFEFINKMKENFSKASLKNLYNNINDATIKRSFIADIRQASGIYNTFSNSILISYSLLQKYTKETFFHELLHLSSTFTNNGLAYSGFSQWKHFYKIGEGLNEGYTQLLTERLCRETASMKTYKEEVKIATALEMIIGKDKMYELYFDANLPGLIEEIGKYSTKEEATKFIMNVDFINDHKIECEHSNRNHRMLQKTYKDIYGLLFKIYTKKKKEEYESKIIKEEEFIDDIINYIEYLELDSGLFSNIENNDRVEILNTSLESIQVKEKVLKKLCI